MGWRAGGGVLFAHAIKEFTCGQDFVMSLMCAISFLIASNLVLSKKVQDHGLLFSCLYWLSLTDFVGMLWGNLRHRQQSLLSKYQSSDSFFGPFCPYKRGLLCGFECKHLCSCFMGYKFLSHAWGKGKGRIWISWAPLWGTTFSSHPMAAAFPKAKQLVGGSEKVTTCLPPGGGRGMRVTVLRMTDEKKNKNSIF